MLMMLDVKYWYWFWCKLAFVEHDPLAKLTCPPKRGLTPHTLILCVLIQGKSAPAKMSTNHETFLISASTDDERQEWIRAIRKNMFFNKGGGKMCIFWMHKLEMMRIQCLVLSFQQNSTNISFYCKLGLTCWSWDYCFAIYCTIVI